jgi:hypothetical protein
MSLQEGKRLARKNCISKISTLQTLTVYTCIYTHKNEENPQKRNLSLLDDF